MYDYAKFKWVYWGKHKGMTKHFRYSDKTITVIYYSHIVSDLILATNMDMASKFVDTIVREELRRYHIQVNKLADHQIEYHSDIVRGSYYVGLGDKASELNKILLRC